MTKKIYAKEFLDDFDFFHLAKQFYRHIYRNKELEQEPEWKEIKLATENFLVMHRSLSEPKSDVQGEDYRDFLRFYTELEIKSEEPTEFIFNKREKDLFFRFITIIKDREQRFF